MCQCDSISQSEEEAHHARVQVHRKVVLPSQGFRQGISVWPFLNIHPCAIEYKSVPSVVSLHPKPSRESLLKSDSFYCSL